MFLLSSELYVCMHRELDHAMLRRLEKRILVDLPSQSARQAMFRHHLPPVISQSAFPITTDIDYENVAMVCYMVFFVHACMVCAQVCILAQAYSHRCTCHMCVVCECMCACACGWVYVSHAYFIIK